MSAWTRREAGLTAALGSAAALAALSVPLNLPWLATVGLVVAAVGASARLGVGWARNRLERRRERVESARRLRVPITAVTHVDQTVIGVDPAAQDLIEGGRLPRYLPRDRDAELVDALVEAIEGRGSRLVVVVGPSKVGKSRTLFQALLACTEVCPSAKDLHVVAPIDGDGLRALLLPGQEPRLGARPAVLWLDDLEPFLNQAVTWQTLRAWTSGGRGRIVVATYGGKGSDLVAEAGATDKLTTAAGLLLQQAREIHLIATSESELGALVSRRAMPSDERTLVARFGLAAFLVAGPALQRKLGTARHAPGAVPCVEGVAVVRAAVDWARCGRTDPITDEILRHVWTSYLPPGTVASDDGFTRGIEWALQPVAGSVALLYRAGSYLAYDYVVRLIRDRPGATGPPDATWRAAVDTAEPDTATAVGEAAYRAHRLEDAAASFRVAHRSSDPAAAALAGGNLGVVLSKLGRPEEAVAVYRQVVDRNGDDPAPAMREQVAGTLVNLGVDLGALGRSEEAVAVYQQVVDRYGEDSTPALREQTATALYATGVRLAVLGRPEEAVSVYRQVVDRYGDDSAPALREQAATALVNTGAVFGVLGRPEEAVAAYWQVVDRYADDPAPVLREQAAKALVNTGAVLGVLGRSEEALAACRQVVDRYGDDASAVLREQTAKALFNMGALLGVLGRSDEALAAYRQVVDRYADDPALREQAAKALVNTGAVLGVLDRPDEALAACREVVDRYGDDASAVLREQTATALFNMAAVLGALGRDDEAAAAYRQVVHRYGDDPTPGLREVVGFATEALDGRSPADDR
ncbi:hypothetical protein GCM10009613_35990 [Pseudonocardia kongjuensis]|uniref:Tetratricopeptide repeat protein n=1 Tax=Pseudonocardia kongjuensis TaxID=102227 RepID=A0ABN1XWS8_9PSEU